MPRSKVVGMWWQGEIILGIMEGEMTVSDPPTVAKERDDVVHHRFHTSDGHEDFGCELVLSKADEIELGSEHIRADSTSMHPLCKLEREALILQIEWPQSSVIGETEIDDSEGEGEPEFSL